VNGEEGVEQEVEPLGVTWGLAAQVLEKGGIERKVAESLAALPVYW
jgi:hypothetical protein